MIRRADGCVYALNADGEIVARYRPSREGGAQLRAGFAHSLGRADLDVETAVEFARAILEEEGEGAAR